MDTVISIISGLALLAIGIAQILWYGKYREKHQAHIAALEGKISSLKDAHHAQIASLREQIETYKVLTSPVLMEHYSATKLALEQAYKDVLKDKEDLQRRIDETEAKSREKSQELAKLLSKPAEVSVAASVAARLAQPDITLADALGDRVYQLFLESEALATENRFLKLLKGRSNVEMVEKPKDGE